VIHNIIDNSIKYSSENPQIDIQLTENKENFILNFKDNGQGIPKEYQDKIFDRFFRVPNEDRHDVKGHGLGLNYVKNIIESLGGKITVESNLNQGAEFKITLPKNVSDV
jgi:signal transduction histidine kinase